VSKAGFTRARGGHVYRSRCRTKAAHAAIGEYQARRQGLVRRRSTGKREAAECRNEIAIPAAQSTNTISKGGKR
jgi:hypothetical protein